MMSETTELWLAIVVFGLMFGLIIFLMIYWSKKGTIVDERDRKWYQEKQNKEKGGAE